MLYLIEIMLESAVQSYFICCILSCKNEPFLIFYQILYRSFKNIIERDKYNLKMENKSTSFNPLVGRLYKNFSQSKLHQKTLILKDISSIRGDSSYRQRSTLFPSLSKISIKESSSRNNLAFEDRKSSDFSILSKNETMLSNHRNRFNKMVLDESKILGDQISMNENNVNKLKDKLKQNKGRIMKKKAIIRSRNRYEGYGNQQNDLTLEDFINLLKQDPDISDQFVYLKVVSHPYDLRIVDFQNKTSQPVLKDERAAIFNKKTPLPTTHKNHDRITISARGITYLNQEEPIFITLQQWSKQAQLYKKLIKLSFFKQYRVWKNFCVWKKFIRRISMKKVSETLSKQLLFADKHIRPSLLFSKSLLLKLENIKLCKLNQSQKQTPTYSDFIQQQNAYRSNDLPNNISYLQDQIIENVIQTCKQSLKAFKQQNRIGNLESGIGGKSEPLLIGDNSNKPMPYTEQATTKTHYEKLTKYMKLVDNLVIDGKLKLMLESVSCLRETIHNQNQQYHTEVISTDEKLMYKGHQWFVCSVFFESSKLTFDPNRSKLQNVFEQLVTKGIDQVCKKHKSIKFVQQLIPYFTVAEETPEMIEQVFSIKDVIRTSDTYTTQYSELMSQVDTSFSYVQNYAQRLLPFLQIYFQNCKQNVQKYKLKDHQQIQKSIEKWKDQDSKLNGIVQQHQCSMMSIQTFKLKDTIKHCSSICLQQIYKILPDMLWQKTSELKSQLKEYKNLLCNSPHNVQEFIQLSQNVNRIGQELDDLSFKLSEVSSLLNIIKNNRGYMGQSMQTLKTKEQRIVELSQLMVLLRTKIDQSTINMNSMKVSFLQEIGKILPQIDQNVEENYIEVSSFDYNADIGAIIEFLSSKQISIDEMFKQNQTLNYYQKNLQSEVTVSSSLKQYSQYFNKIYRIWTYKQRVNQFTQYIRASFLKDISVESQCTRFESLLLDIQQLEKECFAQQGEDESYELGVEDKQIILSLQEQISSYSPVMKSVKAMKDQILKQKELEQISSYMEKKGINPRTVEGILKSTITIESIITSEISKHNKYLIQMTVKANHQAQLAAVLLKISQFWASNYITCSPYLQYKDVFMLQPNAELYRKIDESLVDLNMVMNSKYVDTVVSDAEKQSKLFTQLLEVLEQWKIHQENWLKLEPIFNSSYFKAFPKQLKLFTNADTSWRKIVKVSKEHTVKRWVQHQNILQTLKNNNLLYSNLEKLIPDFLQKKRQIFHRFYMISDEELITILTKCKDFRSAQSYLYKIFPSIQKFEYSSGDKESQPTGLVNFDGEVLPLKMIRVGVEAEEIFKMLEDCMKQSVKSLIKQSLHSLQKQTFKRKIWLKQFPFQVVHLCEMLEWTKLIENDYLCESGEDLNNLYYSQNLQLSETIEMLHDSSCRINPIVLNSLLVQNIECRDTVQRLIVSNAQSVNDLQWCMQIKAYYQNQNYIIKQAKIQISYGYEFLRVFNKMPISPVTDKSRFILFQNLRTLQPLSLTGPSDIFEDTANICGKNIVKINCSFVNKSYLHSLILGAYSSGTWLLFNNMIQKNSELISYIATLVEVVRIQHCRKENIQKSRELGIALSICKSQDLPQSIKSDLRIINLVKPDEWFLLQLQLYKQGLVWGKQFIKQLKSIVQKIQTSLDVKVRIPQLAQSYKSLYISPDEQINFTITHILNTTRNHIVHLYKLDQPSTTAIFNQYLQQRSITLPAFSEPKTQNTNVLNFSTSIIAKGKQKVGKSTWIINQYMKKYPQDVKLQNVMFIHSDSICQEQLFGHQSQKGWVVGSLQEFVEKNQRQKWIVIENPSQQMRSLFDSIIKQKCILFPNNSHINIAPNSLRIFYETSSLSEKQQVFNLNQFSPIQYISKQTQKFKDQLHPYFVELSKQYFIKTISTIRKTFKDSIKLPSDILVANELINILNAFMETSKINAINDRGLQKLFGWSLFIAISNRVGLKSSPYEKFCKAYQQCVKFEHVKVTNLSEYYLSFITPEGVLKSIEPNQSCLKSICSKIWHMKMMINTNKPLILLGSSGTFKSTSINQLIMASPPNHKFIHYNINPLTKLPQFTAFILSQLVIRRNTQQEILEPKGYDNSKLSIFVDDINSNPHIFSFVQNFSLPKYKRMWIQSLNKYIKVSEKLVLHGIVNGRMVYRPLNIFNLTPITFNKEDQSTLTQCFKQALDEKIQVNLMEHLLQTTTQTIKNIKNIYPLRKYSTHDLSKLLNMLVKLKSITKQDWIEKMIFVYCSPLQQNRQQVISLIYTSFNVGPIHNFSMILKQNLHEISTIRIVKEKFRFEDSFQTLSQQYPNIKKYKNKNQIQKLLNSDAKQQTIYFTPNNETSFQQFETISQLCHNSSNYSLKFTFFVDLNSEDLFKQVYSSFVSTIDKYFVVIYDDYAPTDSPLERAFQFFKSRVDINRNNFNQSVKYFNRIVSQKKQQIQNKNREIQNALKSYQIFRENKQKIMKEYEDKSNGLIQKNQNCQTLFSMIKFQNIKMSELKQQLVQKNQKLEESLEGNQENQQQTFEKQEILDLQKRIGFMAKEILKKQQQVQLNTKAKDIFRSQANHLKETLQTISEIETAIDTIMEKLNRQMTDSRQYIANKLQNEALRTSIQIGFLSKHPPQKRQEFLKEYDQKLSQISSLEQFLYNYVQLSTDVCIVYDPSYSSLKVLTKLFPQLFTIVSDIERVPHLKPQNYLVMYVRQTQQQINFFIQTLQKSNAGKLVLLLDYIPTNYPSLNYDKCLKDQNIQDLLIFISNRYLKQMIQSCQDKIENINREIRNKEQQCVKILNKGVQSEKTDYLQNIQSKLGELNSLTDGLKDLQRDLSTNEKEKSQYFHLCKQVSKFVNFVNKFLPKICSVYNYSNQYIEKMISSALFVTQPEPTQQNEFYISRVSNYLFSQAMCSIRQEHTLAAKLIWGLINLDLSEDLISLFLKSYTNQDSNQREKVVSQFKTRCKDFDQSTLKKIQKILRAKLSQSISLQKEIKQFASKISLSQVQINFATSHYYVAQRISVEQIVQNIFKQEPYKIIPSNSLLDKVQETLMLLNPCNLIIKCHQSETNLRSIYLKCLQPSKHNDKQYRIVFMVNKFQNVPAEVLSRCTKISQLQLKSNLKIKESQQDTSTKMSIKEKIHNSSLKTIKRLLQSRKIVHSLSLRYFDTFMLGVINAINEVTTDNSWIILKALDTQNIPEEIKNILLIAYQRVFNDLTKEIAQQNKKQSNSKTQSIIKQKNYSIQSFQIPDFLLSSAARNGLKYFLKNICYQNFVSKIKVDSVISTISAFPLIQVGQNYFSSKSFEEILYKQLLKFNLQISELNTHILELNTFLNSKAMVDDHFEQIINSIKNNQVPQIWLGYKSNKVLNLEKYFQHIKDKIKYLRQLKENEFKFKSFLVEYIPDPLPVIRKLLQIEQKKLKFQNKTLFGKIVVQQNHSHSHISHHNSFISQNGVLLSNIKLRYCKYDSQKLTLQWSYQASNTNVHILLSYGDMTASLNYEKVPLYKNDYSNQQCIMMLELPYKVNSQSISTINPSYLVIDDMGDE